MALTYDPIATTTLSSANSIITFSGIGSGYTDLVLISLLKQSDANTYDLFLRFNGDSATNYSNITMGATGGSGGSYQARSQNTTGIIFSNGSSSSTEFELHQINIFSYAGGRNKRVLINRSGDLSGSGRTSQTSGLWRDVSAITSVSLVRSSGNFAIGSTATLYGIKAA